VLEDISLTINPGEHVGIIGRTGSGKSTLFQAIYRFVKFDSGSKDDLFLVT
jgi:ABC-type multidrug transport system fused ATPase/permease subunit